MRHHRPEYVRLAAAKRETWQRTHEPRSKVILETVIAMVLAKQPCDDVLAQMVRNTELTPALAWPGSLKLEKIASIPWNPVWSASVSPTLLVVAVNAGLVKYTSRFRGVTVEYDSGPAGDFGGPGPGAVLWIHAWVLSV